MRAGALLCAIAGSVTAANNYLVHKLVSDLPGVADHVDKNLVNPWGTGFSSASPFWIGNNGSGTSTLYDTSGTAIPLIVNIPSPAGGSSHGAVTGVIANGNTTSFNVAVGKAASFLFCTEDGTITGWNSSVDATNAKIMIDKSNLGAVYKGCALGGTSAAPLLFAANFNSGKIDVWDGNLNAVLNANAFVDPMVTAGFAPFNIQNLGGKLYVTYAKQDDDKHDDVAGVGNGFIAVFDFSGTLLANLVSQGPLNSPWGIAIAPATFGDFAGALLVGNFGDGMIHAFNLTTGALMGTLNDTIGSPIAIPGLWSLNFGNGGRGGDTSTLYFTAGIGGPGNETPLETHGLFGSIQAAPSFQVSGIQNGGSFSGHIAPNAWVSIKGGGLSATTRSWTTADFKGNLLPTQLDGVGVTVNGTAAAISFISPAQINFLAPSNMSPGPVQIQTTNNGLTSAAQSATLDAVAPAFFIIGTNSNSGNQYIAALHPDFSVVGPPSLITGVTTSPTKVGEIVAMYANGLGPTNPAIPIGQLLTVPLPLPALPTVTIGGVNALVTFAGLVGPGLYQVNVLVPAGLKPGEAIAFLDYPVVMTVGGVQAQSTAVITVVNPVP